MTETCKIDGQIEEIKRLISEGKSDVSKLETRLTDLEGQRTRLKNPNASRVLDLVRQYSGYYKNPISEPYLDDVMLSYSVGGMQDYIGGALSSDLHKEGFWVRYIRTYGHRIEVLIQKD